MRCKQPQQSKLWPMTNAIKDSVASCSYHRILQNAKVADESYTSFFNV